MRHLQLLNLCLAALAATFSVVLVVVCLMYAMNLDVAPRLQRELPRLLVTTALFASFALFAALVWWAHNEKKSWAWWSQAALLPALVMTAFGFVSLAGLA